MTDSRHSLGFWETRVLDLGTGPGVMALAMVKRGAEVTGLDISHNQVEVASNCARATAQASHCCFLQATAENTPLATGLFDWVTAGQCWHWFDSSFTLREAHRLLKPTGILVIAHYSYLASRSEVARLSEELVLRHNPGWTMANSSGMYPNQIEEVLAAGFDLADQFCYHHNETFSHEAWRGRMRTCNGVGSRIADQESVEAFDRDLESLLRERFEDPVTVVHRLWAVVARKKGKSRKAHD